MIQHQSHYHIILLLDHSVDLSKLFHRVYLNYLKFVYKQQVNQFNEKNIPKTSNFLIQVINWRQISIKYFVTSLKPKDYVVFFVVYTQLFGEIRLRMVIIITYFFH